jgi:hypothetical protein
VPGRRQDLLKRYAVVENTGQEPIMLEQVKVLEQPEVKLDLQRVVGITQRNHQLWRAFVTYRVVPRRPDARRALRRQTLP